MKYASWRVVTHFGLGKCIACEFKELKKYDKYHLEVDEPNFDFINDTIFQGLLESTFRKEATSAP